MTLDNSSVQAAAQHIAHADALFISAGAGMGVDSGLPDFRGVQGFWRAYPAFERLGHSFADMANPAWFSRDPELAWGFYGHRLHMYQATQPHAGFSLLKQWAAGRPDGCFVFTSNVDGQFQAGGFVEAQVVECHGSIHHLQCTTPCNPGLWPVGELRLEVDPDTIRASAPLPTCPQCGAIARPNILMFGDANFIGSRVDTQERRMVHWLNQRLDTRTPQKLAIIECGAGTAVPTVRWQSERVSKAFDVPLIRINPRDGRGPAGTISLASGALDTLTAIDQAMRAL